MRGNAMASTGRYAAAQTGAPKLRTQPPATGITSCRVAFTPATFQAHDRPSTNSVISHGRCTSATVEMVPLVPEVNSTFQFTRAPETVGPHFELPAHCCDIRAVGEHPVRLTELADDLLRGVTLPAVRHDLTSLPTRSYGRQDDSQDHRTYKRGPPSVADHKRGVTCSLRVRRMRVCAARKGV